VLFVHVPAAWLTYLAFGITLSGSAMYLWKKDLRWDRLAASSAEIVHFSVESWRTLHQRATIFNTDGM